MAGKGSSQRGDGAERQIVETEKSREKLFVHEIPQTSDGKGDQRAVWWEGRQKTVKTW